MRRASIGPLNPHNHPRYWHGYSPHCTEEKTEAPGDNLAGSETKLSSSRGCRPCPSHQQAARIWGIRGIQSQGPVKKEGVCTHSRLRQGQAEDPREACLGKLSKLTSSPPLYSELPACLFGFLLPRVAGMWDLPGMEASPLHQKHRVLTTEPRGSPPVCLLMCLSQKKIKDVLCLYLLSTLPGLPR